MWRLRRCDKYTFMSRATLSLSAQETALAWVLTDIDATMAWGQDACDAYTALRGRRKFSTEGTRLRNTWMKACRRLTRLAHHADVLLDRMTRIQTDHRRRTLAAQA